MNDTNFVTQALFSEILRCGCATRTQLARDLHLRPATLSAVVERLKAKGYLIEPDRRSPHTGRKASGLMLNPKSGSFIGLELTPTRIYGVLIHANGEEERRQSVAVQPDAPERKLCSLIVSVIQSLRLSGNGGMVGFADPGTYDLKTGQALQTVNLPAWEQVNVLNFLRENTGDSSPMVAPETLIRTYGEYIHCAPDFPETLFHARFSDGIGGGFINRGQLLIGNGCSSMELGHIVVSRNGRRCRCGNRGCLEAMAGADALRQMMQELATSGVSTRMNLAQFSLTEFVRMVHEKDRAATVLAQETCERIAPVIAMITTLLNPQMIVLSGELAGLGNLLLDTVKRAISLRKLNPNAAQIQIRLSALDEFAGAKAAALLRRNSYFENILGLHVKNLPPLAAGL